MGEGEHYGCEAKKKKKTLVLCCQQQMQIFKQENDIEYMFALGRLLCDQSERMEEWLLQWFR